jgi:hypothetical protein
MSDSDANEKCVRVCVCVCVWGGGVISHKNPYDCRGEQQQQARRSTLIVHHYDEETRHQLLSMHSETTVRPMCRVNI